MIYVTLEIEKELDVSGLPGRVVKICSSDEFGWIRPIGIRAVIVHPLDIIEVKVGGITFGPRPEREVNLKRGTVEYYRHVVDEGGVPYVQDDGDLPAWAEYVATDREGKAYCYPVRPYPCYCPVLWDMPGNEKFMQLDKKYANTIVVWDKTLRRIWRH